MSRVLGSRRGDVVILSQHKRKLSTPPRLKVGVVFTVLEGRSKVDYTIVVSVKGELD